MSLVEILPTVNASLNAAAGIFLYFGWRAIRLKNQILHRNWMIAAFCTSTLFLCSYLTYHFIKQGITRYQGEGICRPIYFFILWTHTPLATLIVPFILAALWFAYRRDFRRHTQITRWLLPVWMYVSITGVLIYLMLYIFS